ncbi:hypothetical protein FGO68_gene294 [Halteria grandinella]|uniref:RING-type domain-containing protein n=1 Tax=Halteria grandinella TaxID=5974 RepID=A0A8J8NLE9_HALGN|nr:hypothetical protein FGO68_gene294 [Halteria grandinella]
MTHDSAQLWDRIWSHRFTSTTASEALCPICFELISTDSFIVLPCDSRHIFHKVCIRTWFEHSAKICPLCKHPVRSLDLVNLMN